MTIQALCLNSCGNHVKAKGRKFCSYRCMGEYNKAHSKTINLYPREFNKEFRERIRAREGNRCILCHAPQGDFETGGPYLVVHHVDWDPANTTEKNCCLVCLRCHTTIHGSKNPEEWIFWLKSIMAMRGLIDFPEAHIPVGVIGSHVTKVKAKYAQWGIVF